jgi:hypothetical protein
MFLAHKWLDTACLAGLALDTLGGLYLAYDLLGGERGILRLATKCITYSIIFFAIYAALLGRWFGIAGAIVYGPVMAIQHSTRSNQPGAYRWMLLYAALRAGCMGAAGWFVVDPRFGVAFGVLGTVALMLSYASLGTMGVETASEWAPPRINYEALVTGASRGFAFGAAAVLSALLIQRHPGGVVRNMGRRRDRRLQRAVHHIKPLSRMVGRPPPGAPPRRLRCLAGRRRVGHPGPAIPAPAARCRDIIEPPEVERLPHTSGAERYARK